MGQLRYPPHVKVDHCPTCPSGFVPRQANCCGDGQLHVVSIFAHGKTRQKMMLLECSDCGRHLDECRP